MLNLYRDWMIIAGRAMTDVRFHQPVRAGSTLTGTVTITGVERRDERRSLVHKFGQLFDVSGEPVFSVKVEAYLMNRPAEAVG